MRLNSSIYVTGHKGLLGSALVSVLQAQGYINIWTASRSEVDLMNPAQTDWFFKEAAPEFVFHCAATVGGIDANRRHGAKFLYENLTIQNNVMTSAVRAGVKGFIFVGSAAMYPDKITRMIGPDDLMSGPLDETKGGYAMAKLAGAKLCQCIRRETGRQFFTVIPNNLYGPGDNYEAATSHVIPAMIRKYHEGRQTGQVVNWGNGTARREFIYSQDAARAMVLLMNTYLGAAPVNIGVQADHSMKDLGQIIAQITGFNGKVAWDHTKPEGTMRRLLDSSFLWKLGWRPQFSLGEGLALAYKDFLSESVTPF